MRSGLRFQPSIFWLWAALAAAFIAYTLPWVVNPSVGLTFGAYDLAEWASLHPQVRAAPLGLTSLILRLQVGVLAWIVAFNIPIRPSARIWWINALLFSLIGIALLPPLEFFTQAQGDGNYQQQFAIAVLTGLGSAIGLSGTAYRWRGRITIALATAGISMIIIALIQVSDLMSQFKLAAQIGLGGLTLIGVYVGIATFYGVLQSKNTQGSL